MDNTGDSRNPLVKEEIDYENDFFHKSEPVDLLTSDIKEESDDIRDYAHTTPINIPIKIEEAQINIGKSKDQRQEIETVILKPTEASLFCTECQQTYEDFCPLHSTSDPLQMNSIPNKTSDTPSSPQTFLRSDSVSGKFVQPNIASKKRTFRCSTCGEVFDSKHHRWKHQRNHDKPFVKGKLYKCNYCDHLDDKKCADFVQHMLHKYGN